jgi:hypothetical protein
VNKKRIKKLKKNKLKHFGRGEGLKRKSLGFLQKKIETKKKH